MRVENRADWLVFTDIFVQRIYDEAIAIALDAADVSRTFHVVDLGANVGYFALRLLDVAMQRPDRQLPIKLDLVEGSASLCAELRTRLSGQLPPNVSVTITNGLVGARTGHAELYESEFHIGNSLRPERYAQRSFVDYVDLDKLTESAPVIDLFKCDIEGTEQMLLENYPGLLDRVRVGAMELHHSLCDTRRCYELLGQLRFHVHATRATECFDEVLFQRR